MTFRQKMGNFLLPSRYRWVVVSGTPVEVPEETKAALKELADEMAKSLRSWHFPSNFRPPR